MKELMFWQEAKNLAYTGEVDAKLPARVFPDTDMVHHFHPMAWVKQMKLILGNGMPPWMEYALKKAEEMAGIDEGVEPLFTFAKKSLEFGGNNYRPDDNTNGQWCGAFVSRCLNETGFKVAPNKWDRLRSQAFITLNGQIFKKVDAPVFGCIVVMTNYKKSDGSSKGSGHVTLLYGIDGNNLVCLGGNQGSKLKFSSYKKEGVSYNSKTYEQKFNSFLMPIDYPENYYNYEIPEITVNKANKKFGINLKTLKNESTL